MEGNNYGTPKAANLSENDLSSLACVVPTVTLTPSVELTVAEDKKSASFSVKNISAYLKLSYELTYDSYDQTKGALGSGVDISGKTDFSREIDLATCSNEICTYDQNVHNFTIKITLEDTDAKQTILQQSL
ncbi:MAG: hypothetical protein NT149_03970 [Candidatus Gottesmanbacteria bacterium]|nr:hypothetical protein [Candidatus Gottesmanbacteria bacterium]